MKFTAEIFAAILFGLTSICAITAAIYLHVIAIRQRNVNSKKKSDSINSKTWQELTSFDKPSNYISGDRGSFKAKYTIGSFMVQAMLADVVSKKENNQRNNIRHSHRDRSIGGRSSLHQKDVTRSLKASYPNKLDKCA